VKHETFPTIAQALLLVIALILLEMLVGAALSDFKQALSLNPSEIGAFATLLGNGLLFATVLNAKAMKYRDLFNPSGSSVPATIALLGLPIAALVPLLVLLGTTLGDLLAKLLPLSAWEQQAFSEMAAQNLSAVTTVCILAPMLEEMLFRGIILRSFLVQYDRRTAIVASALIFGAAHLNIYQFCIATCLGVVSGWLYERARSLVPCIALHALYNTLVTAIDFNAPPNASEEAQGFAPATWAYALLLGAAGAYGLARVLNSGSGKSKAN
jgi:uncharacterized protein